MKNAGNADNLLSSQLIFRSFQEPADGTFRNTNLGSKLCLRDSFIKS